MEKKKVFVIMPFQDQFFEVYEMLKMKEISRTFLKILFNLFMKQMSLLRT